jgi:hypothetical protein
MRIQTYRDQTFSRHFDLIGGVLHSWSIDLVSLAASSLLVPRHSGSDWLIPSQSRMGRSSGGTRIWMLRATPG